MNNIDNTITNFADLGKEHEWLLKIMNEVRNRVDMFFKSAKFIDEELIQQLKLSLLYNIICIVKKDFSSFLWHTPSGIELKKRELSNYISIYLKSSKDYSKFNDKTSEWMISKIKEIKDEIEDKKTITININSNIENQKPIKRSNTNKGRKPTHLIAINKSSLQTAIKNIPNYLDISQNKLAQELHLSPSYFSELLTKYNIIVKDI